MNRRELLAAFTALSAHNQALDLFAQQVAPALDMPDDPRRREYAICKVRGHQADFSRPGTLQASVRAFLRRIPFFYVCRWCKTTYRYDDNGILHETGAPENG